MASPPCSARSIDSGAIQCGFCTPGFVIALTELFAREPRPGTRGDPRRAVGQPLPLLGLCEDRRGGGAAGQEDADDDRFEPPAPGGGDKVTGRARYADDIALPGMLHAALLTSPHAHARIVGCRVEAARAIPGVKAIVTGADLDRAALGRHDQGRVDGRARQGALRRRGGGGGRGDRSRDRRPGRRGDRDRLRAAAGGAFDRRGARPRCADPARGLRLVRQDRPGRRARQRRVREHAWRKATSSEASAIATWWSRAPGRPRRSTTSTWSRMAAWRTSTRPGASRSTRRASRCTSIQQRVAEELGEPMARIRVVATRVGGGFGGKHASNIHSIAAWLARAARRAGQAGPVPHAGLRDAALAPPGAHLDEDGRAARRHHPGARRAHHARRRRLRRREPAGARLRAAHVARALPHSECARARPGHLHEQAARRLVPRLRQPAGELCGRVRRSTSSPRSSASTRSSCA